MASLRRRMASAIAFLSTAALLLPPALAEPASYCARGAGSVCFHWAIPPSSSSSPSPPDPIFLRIQAPVSYEWVALGMGPDMPDSSIFVIYQNGAGNITLSTRPGADHVMPTYEARPDVQLLAGSGVNSGVVNGNDGASDGSDTTISTTTTTTTTTTMMVANIRCEDWCAKLARDGPNPWTAAWRVGGSMDTPDPAAPLAQHDSHDQFAVDFSIAGSVSTPASSFMAGDFFGTADGSGGGASSAVTSLGISIETLRAAHGLLMAIVFIVLYPVGAMLMPLLGKWYVHAAWQSVALVAMWAAFGIGYVVAHRQNIFFDTAHTRLGIFVICLTTLQPITGQIHHRIFLKTASRSIWSHAHIWLARALILIAIVNGGLGIADRAADITDHVRRTYVIAYAVVAALMGALYIAVAVVVPWSKKGGSGGGGRGVWPGKTKRLASPQETTQFD